MPHQDAVAVGAPGADALSIEALVLVLSRLGPIGFSGNQASYIGSQLASQPGAFVTGAATCGRVRQP